MRKQIVCFAVELVFESARAQESERAEEREEVREREKTNTQPTNSYTLE